MVHEALQAQTAAITALAGELKAARESAPREPKPKTEPAADKEPGANVPWYYR